jgi:signal transduction histidine kinase
MSLSALEQLRHEAALTRSSASVAPASRSPSWLRRGARWLDWFIPATVRQEAREELFRARVSVGVAWLAFVLFVSLAAIRASDGKWTTMGINLGQAATLVGFALALRKFGRLRVLILASITTIYVSLVAVVLVSAGAGFTLPGVGMAIMPLCATLLSGVSAGAVWAAFSCAANAALGVLAATGHIPYKRPIEGLLPEHLTLFVLTLLMYFIAMLYEFRKAESLEQVEALERERHAADAKSKLVEAERLAALGQIAAMAAHEINNPLSYVMNSLEHVQAWLGKAAPPEPVLEAVQDTLDGVHRIRRIVDDLRDYACPNEETAVADVHRAIVTALKTAEGHTRPRARVTTALDDVPPVFANHGRLVQVILNFVVNAAQAIPEGRAAMNEIAVRAFERADGKVCVEVSDTGPGIRDSIIDHVREPFFTTKSRGEGSGLGLALSDHILQRCGGSLEIQSSSRGAVVRAILVAAPRTSVSPQFAVSRAPSSVPPATRGLRILVIDDEPLVARSIGRRLKEHDMTVALSGAEALALLDGGGAFDAILCDVMMPELTGMDVYDLIRERHPQMLEKIIFMTGGMFTERAARFRASVENTFLSKPLDVRQIRQAMEGTSAGPVPIAGILR